jgi:hypothetical protein
VVSDGNEGLQGVAVELPHSLCLCYPDCFFHVGLMLCRRANVVRFYERAMKRVTFFASRDIHPGEELLFDYGRNYWRGREHLELP